MGWFAIAFFFVAARAKHRGNKLMFLWSLVGAFYFCGFELAINLVARPVADVMIIAGII